MIKTRQQGVTLIEVLVTIALLGFGFLSLAMFQIGTIKALSGTNQHYLATALAVSVAESMRANSANATDYVRQSVRAFDKNCAIASECSTAENDLYRWRQSFTQHAVEGLDASIRIEQNSGTASISISWIEKVGFGLITDEENLQTYQVQVPL